MTLRDSHYDETVEALKADPIIQGMAEEIAFLPSSEMTHDSGTPRYNFMMAALNEYKARGGQVQTHLGGPAEAIIELLKGQDND